MWEVILGKAGPGRGRACGASLSSWWCCGCWSVILLGLWAVTRHGLEDVAPRWGVSGYLRTYLHQLLETLTTSYFWLALCAGGVGSGGWNSLSQVLAAGSHLLHKASSPLSRGRMCNMPECSLQTPVAHGPSFSSVLISCVPLRLSLKLRVPRFSYL